MTRQRQVHLAVAVEIGRGDVPVVERQLGVFGLRPTAPAALAVAQEDDRLGAALARRTVRDVQLAIAVHVRDREPVAPLTGGRQASAPRHEAQPIGGVELGDVSGGGALTLLGRASGLGPPRRRRSGGGTVDLHPEGGLVVVDDVEREAAQELDLLALLLPDPAATDLVDAVHEVRPAELVDEPLAVRRLERDRALHRHDVALRVGGLGRNAHRLRAVGGGLARRRRRVRRRRRRAARGLRGAADEEQRQADSRRCRAPDTKDEIHCQDLLARSQPSGRLVWLFRYFDLRFGDGCSCSRARR